MMEMAIIKKMAKHKKPGAGGKRPGAGAPKKEDKKVQIFIMVEKSILTRNGGVPASKKAAYKFLKENQE